MCKVSAPSDVEVSQIETNLRTAMYRAFRELKQQHPNVCLLPRFPLPGRNLRLVGDAPILCVKAKDGTPTPICWCEAKYQKEQGNAAKNGIADKILLLARLSISGISPLLGFCYGEGFKDGQANLKFLQAYLDSPINTLDDSSKGCIFAQHELFTVDFMAEKIIEFSSNMLVRILYPCK